MSAAFDVSGAVAVVTGGNSGIGKAAIEALNAEGATALSWDLDGPGVHCDVTDADSVREAMAATVAEYGVPTIHVASAGTARLAKIVDLTIEEWDFVYNVNIRGVFLTLQAAAREMTTAGLPGSIIVIGSVNGALADPAHSPYSTSKAAVAHLARCAAVELGEEGIRVNAIAPGPTATPMMGPLLSHEGYREEIGGSTPLGRIGEPEDIALAIVNVIKSPWITGQVIAVDGGSQLVTPRGRDRAVRVTDERRARAGA
jgi:NAD(P)-dependent dehydrogenase (short-subunit alcohol dehydrogenase family)